jgi:CubicO group peptidase (beta-lactamase class C family)
MSGLNRAATPCTRIVWVPRKSTLTRTSSPATLDDPHVVHAAVEAAGECVARTAQRSGHGVLNGRGAAAAAGCDIVGAMSERRGASRRSFLLSAGAFAVGAPAAAQERPRRRPPSPWSKSADRARGLEQLHALVITHDGSTVMAEAFRGPAVERPVNVKSVSKSVVAALAGAAIDRGEVPGLEATLGEVIPDLIPASADPRVAAITLGDLVTLRAGLERTSGAGYDAWVSSPNWVAYVLERPFVAAPGGRMLYSTGSVHVLGAALARASGRSLLAQARERIGDPLGIEIPAWTRDPQGFYLGGNEMALSPLAMAAFGEMYRLGGRSGAMQILSEDWVAASWVPRTRSPFSGLDYGYGWFLGRAAGRRLALARGYGGQVVAVLPEIAVTVAITSDPTRPARSEGYFGELTRLIAEAVVPDAEALGS